MLFEQFSSNENKGLVWSLLQESGVFTNLPNQYFEKVKVLFETTIVQMKKEFITFEDENDEAQSDYNEKVKQLLLQINKIVMRKMIEGIKIINQQSSQQNVQGRPMQPFNNVGNNQSTKKSKIEMIYKAEDIQKERMSDLDGQLRMKQDEMNSFLKIKKPEEINFNDRIEDEKIGDSMDRLIANALSSRERELEQLQTNMNKEEAEKWINGGDVKRPKTVIVEQNEKKKVTFNESNNQEFELEENNNEIKINENNENNFIMKLKRNNNNIISNISKSLESNEIMLDIIEKEVGENVEYENQEVYRINSQDVRDYEKLENKINILKMDVEQIKETQNKILELLMQKSI